MTRSASSLGLADARRIIAAGERKALEIGIPYNIAVDDAGGSLLAHIRMEENRRFFGVLDSNLEQYHSPKCRSSKARQKGRA